MVIADISMINNKTLRCIVDYYSKYPIVKKVGSLAVDDDLVQMAKMAFAEYGLPKNIVSDTGMNFTSEKFREFCRLMNIQHSITSSYHNQSNSQVEASINL